MNWLMRNQDSDRIYLIVSTFMIKYGRPPTAGEIKQAWKSAYPNLKPLSDGKLHDVIGRDARMRKEGYDFELHETLHLVCKVCKGSIRHNLSIEIERECNCEHR